MPKRIFMPFSVIRATLPLLLAFHALAAETALDRYVKKPDPSYRYELVRTTPGEGYTTYTIDLTSQTWRPASDVDRSVWKHWLTIVKPDRVTLETERMSGIMIGAGFEVRYHVRAPKNAVVNLTNTNGAILVTAFGGGTGADSGFAGKLSPVRSPPIPGIETSSRTRSTGRC